MPLCALHRRLPIPSLGGIAADTPAGTAKMPLNPLLGKKICHPSAFFTPPRLTFNTRRSARPEVPRSLVLPYGINFQATSHGEYLNTFSCDIFATVLRDIFEHPLWGSHGVPFTIGADGFSDRLGEIELIGRTGCRRPQPWMLRRTQAH